MAIEEFLYQIVQRNVGAAHDQLAMQIEDGDSFVFPLMNFKSRVMQHTL